jgi:hypothetical protein
MADDYLIGEVLGDSAAPVRGRLEDLYASKVRQTLDRMGATRKLLLWESATNSFYAILKNGEIRRGNIVKWQRNSPVFGFMASNSGDNHLPNCLPANWLGPNGEFVYIEEGAEGDDF